MNSTVSQDIPIEAFEDASAALDRRREAQDRYTTLLDAQRLALESGEIRLMDRLAKDVDRIMRELQWDWDDIAAARSYLADPFFDGPRVTTLRDRIIIVGAQMSLAQAGLRELTTKLSFSRDSVVRELSDLLREAAVGPETAHPTSKLLDLRA